jgi:hypothetical protein
MKNYYSIFILIIILFTLNFLDQKILAGQEESGVIINEIFFDPVGSDSPNEWIELYNPTDQTVSMNNWKIHVAGSSFTESSTFTGQIPSHEYYIICENNVPNCNLYVPKIAMQNGGGATDAVSIVNNNWVVIDQVFYDIPNVNNLKDMFGNTVLSNSASVIGVSGESLGRSSFIDTNISAQDFFVYTTPTPGSQNSSEIIEEELPQTGDYSLIIVILLIFIFSGILITRVNLFKYIDVKIYQKSK